MKIDASALLDPGDTLVSPLRPLASRGAEFGNGDELGEGRFVIEHVLGRGGMGIVYAALDRVRERRVALKMLRITDPTALNVLKHEFRSLADVQHPGLARLHELFWERDCCYFTMDLLVGVTFLEYVLVPESGGLPGPDEPTLRSDEPTRTRARAPLASSRLNEARLRSCLGQLVDAVDFLHGEGKVHGDLKPSNVHIDDAGKLTLLDFGLVRDERHDAQGPRAAGAFIAGTPLYMAPELFDGAAPSKESDWYAVGVMLYQALTRRDPFAELGQALIEEKCERSPLAPQKLVERVSEPLAELAMRLLSRIPAERPSAAELREALGVPAPKHGVVPSPRRARLFGRDQELVQLRRAFGNQRARGAPLLVRVVGSSGVGKSALLEEFASELRGAGVNVLFGRCHEHEWVPHKAFDEIVEALAGYLATFSPAELEPLLPRESAALISIFPVLAQALARVEQKSGTELVNPREHRRRAYQGLAALLSTVAKREPSVIVIDDLHWGDTDSARLLLELLGGAGAPPCLFVVSYRDEERGTNACLEQLIAGEQRLAELLEIRELRVSALDPGESRALAASLLGATASRREALIDAVCAEANGNPLLLRELSSYGATALEGDTVDLGHVVRTRLSRLTPQARHLFELVCVSGRPLSPAIAARALCGTAIAEAITSLHGQRLVRERSGPRPDALDVFHDRIRAATLSELPAVEVRERHLALALAYEAAGTQEPEAAAHHYARAGESQKASLWAERAARDSATVLALGRAAELYRLAYDHCEEPARRARLRLRLAHALSDAGRGSEAARWFLEAASEVSGGEALELRRHAAEQLLVSGHLSEGLDVLSRVLAEVGLKLPRTPRKALWDLIVTRARLSLRGLEVKPRRAEELDGRQLLRADACKASWALSFVNTIQGAAFQARFLEEALKSGEPRRVAIGLGMEALYRSTEGQANEPRVRQLQAAAQALAEQLEDPHAQAFEHLVHGQSSYLYGRWGDAAASLERTERILIERCKNVTWELNSSRFFWGNSLVHLGRWRELEQRLTAWDEDAADRGDLYAQASLGLIRARTVILASDDLERAEQQIDAALALWRSSEFGVLEFLAEMSRTQIYLYCGDTEQALAIVERVWPKFSASLMQRIQLCRIHLYQHTAFALLSYAYDTGDRSSLKRIAGYAGKLSSEAAPWARGFALEIRACLHELGAERELANTLRQRAEEALEAAGMTLYAAACRARRARALGSGSEARSLWDSALARIAEQSVLRPQRLIAMMAPGDD